jgi:MFS transporter, DHA2 family, multidrug resistance protein
MMSFVSSTSPAPAGRREWLGLAVLALPSLLTSIDLFVMLLALPHLSTALKASSTDQLWITDMYGFMLSGFLITMGTLGDRVGRRKVLLAGAACFGIASLLAAFSTSVGRGSFLTCWAARCWPRPARRS